MTIENPVRTIDELSDWELEDCYDGTTNNDLVRRLVVEHTTNEGWVDSEKFGYAFAREIEGFIAADEIEEPDEWEESWEANREWGETIADNINEALAIEEPDYYKE